MYTVDFSWTHALSINIAFSLLFWWVIFHKAGKPSWYSLVPFLNVLTIIEISGRPKWWFLLLFVPIVNVIVMIIVWLDIAKAFGKGWGFGLGLYLFTPLFGTILALSDAHYLPTTAIVTEYKPKLSVAIVLSLLVLSMIISFFVVNWLTVPFQDSNSSNPQNLTPFEIVRGTNEAKSFLSMDNNGRVLIRPHRSIGTDDSLPFFHRFLILIPLLAGLLLLLVWAYYLQKYIPFLSYEMTIVALLNLTIILWVAPFLWQLATNSYLKIQLVERPITYIERSLFDLNAWYTFETQVMLASLMVALVLGEYGVFLHDRRFLQTSRLDAEVQNQSDKRDIGAIETF